MRAALIHRHGGIESVRVEDVPVPSPAAGEVRVGLRAAALNHLDLFVVDGIPGLQLPMPHILGSDGAGVIEEVGEGVSSCSVGDEVVLNPGLWCGNCEYCLAGEESTCVGYRLLGEHVDGTFAEALAVPEANCHPKPPDLSWVEAAAFPLVTLTAWRMLVSKARVREGETVLIHGIGGGASLAALRIARRAGARVYVTSHSEEKRTRALELGAEAAIDYTTMDVAQEICRLTGKRGVDIVVDNVGEATFAASIKACSKGGRIVTCGATTGADIPVDVRRLFWGQLTILGSTMGNEAEFRAMLAAVRAGDLQPVVDRSYPLDEVADALGRLRAAEQLGKIVLRIHS
ncbi:MAG: zinc-binding dehydrogenase [Acidobacteriota bacterium]